MGLAPGAGPARVLARRGPFEPFDPDLPAGTTAVAPDLEDIVIALSLARRDAVRS